ncbi:unnamed protein product [Rotaria socialis]|uniref:Alpha-1,2-mannosidase n=1 Tax=Rotaria socialis TaxID=392032 RepID=A0A820AW10_9BILA|nr:unnamed protein product [Rotaria socialis]CAF4183390.1 unnamed protein product [Rotaria socialis]
MKTNNILLILVFILGVNDCDAKTITEFPPMSLYIGTDGDGFGAGSLPLGVQSPYGALRLGADTSNTLNVPIIFNHLGGYHYSDTHIDVFSHTHMFGAGVQDYGEVGIMPTQITSTKQLEEMISKRNGYRSAFRHEREVVQPGYYQVYLDTHQINVELTATEQVGIHRYTYDKIKNKHHAILIDSSYTLQARACNRSQINIDTTNYEITGLIFIEGSLSKRFGGLATYFVITFDHEWADFGVWNDGEIIEKQNQTNGCSSGAYIILPDEHEQITMYVGISFISIDQARTNLHMQTNIFQPFDSLRTIVQQKWLDELSRFEVSAEWDREAEIKFNSALVHSLSSPTQWDESNGAYLGFDGQIHTKPDYMQHVYTDLSIWDVFRTQIPFILFHDSQRANDIIHSIMINVEQGGDLPKWPFANGYTGCMIGSHADILISDLIMKKEHDQHLNLTQVTQALRKVANQNQVHDGRFDPAAYIKYQYVPYDMDHDSASLTLSYSYDDWAIGNVMNAAGLTDEAKEYYERSTWFEHVFDSETKFFCPKNTTGKFYCPENEIEFINPFDNRYVEGDAWHYRFFVPHKNPLEYDRIISNTSRLIELFGGRDNFIEELNSFFQRGQPWTSTLLPNPYYWPGNEHNLFSVWQFNYANRSDLTQKYARWLLNHAYTMKPDGLPGNDDYGTMSAWYLFTSMGFYPLSGSSTYLIGSPAFDRIKITRKNTECVLLINVHNNSPTNIYVERVLLNGEILLTFPFLDHIDHLKCSDDNQSNIQLDFFMSPTPVLSYDK